MQMLIGLGGNLEDPVKTLFAALAALREIPQTDVICHSSFYRTKPVGYRDQPDFTNAVAVVETALSPTAMLGVCLGIEAAFGRTRRFPNAPRTLDLDLLLAADGTTVQTAELTLPHPRLRERAFVLLPFAELFPDGRFGVYDLSAEIQAVSKEEIFKLSTD